MYAGDTHYNAPLDKGHLEKVVLAQKVGQTIVQNESVHERIAAESIARSLIADVSVIVRQTLAFELRRAKKVSYDIAEKIAKDVYEVSSPFLEATRALTDKDLLKLLPELDEAALVAIAKRSALSAELTFGVVDKGGDRSATYIMRNNGATLMADACKRAFEKFDPSSSVFTEMAQRSDLTAEVAKKLVEFVADEYKQQLMKNYSLDAKAATHMVSVAKELTLAQVLALSDTKYVDSYIAGLIKTKRLTAEVLIKSAEMGSRYFFEKSLSELTFIPVENIELLASKGGKLALDKLLKKAKIPLTYHRRFESAVSKLYGSS